MRIAIELPSTTKRFDLEKDLLGLLQWAESKKIEQTHFNIEELVDELKSLLEAQRSWNGRGYMPEKDFKNFALESTLANSKYQKVKKRMRDSFANKNIDPGVYVGVMIETKADINTLFLHP